MKRLKINLMIVLVWLVVCPAMAQYERLGGVYYAYPVTKTELAETPEGYEPFYISHYGRHGSRWLPQDKRYIWVNQHFEDTDNLTKLGKSVRKRLAKIWKNAEGNGGKLTALGGRQHRGIARRMYENFPQLFTSEAHLTARSSVVGRCRTSMENFLASLERQASIDHLEGVTDSADMAWIAYTSPEMKALENRTYVPLKVSPERFVKSLFIDPSKVENPNRLLSELHTIASDMQDVELNVSLYDIFTPEELEAVYDMNNERMTLCNGNHILNEGIPARSAISLWQRIEADADAAIARGDKGADLRFGHDTNLYRLLTLMGVSFRGERSEVRGERYDLMDEILPMAANLQMVFYRGKRLEVSGERLEVSGERLEVRGERTDSDDEVLVQLLHNEHPVTIGNLSPLTSHLSPLTSPPSPLYSWKALKQHVAQRIHNLEHLRQLCSLNTMVGTAPANTKTAGLFGKGSEEHGQTLPAVLSPNGQNFWTPQTRDTEKKCVAPYYYTDSLFQGFRNSHWIVGGCTQDYGSTTISVFSGHWGRIRSVEESASHFSHDEEVSHPHYYAVRLPDEHLRLEMTGSSHAAIFRITPEQDEDVHVTIRPNSDEDQGYVMVDTINKTVYASNPVHRIYQGWGEPAGFRGHFILKYTGELKGAMKSPDDLLGGGGHYPRLIQLTFRGKAHQPIILKAASSFTSRKGAEKNFASEVEGISFDEMAGNTAQTWIARLHTIDVEDPDTARVNQFYGALYRASFLPREMSDIDGRFPKFSSNTSMTSMTSITSTTSKASTASQASPTRKYYGDYSMWDTYRAVHPLYNIIAPSLSADMMQSLVTMYEQGGWLPIFPCWNSYTAAMIGDHCSVVLADAYVKGIRDFDYEKAYEGMRKNAFETPASFEDYKNGMGRRALESYLNYGYIPLEDSVKEAFHTNEQTSRTMEYAFDDFAVAQMAKALGKTNDYEQLMRRSENWRNVINPKTGYCDGRQAPKAKTRRQKADNGVFEDNTDFVHRKSFITEGATCHYTWYVPQNVEGLVEMLGGKERFEAKLDSMFTEGRYWHGNEPCHQIAYLYDFIGKRDKTIERVNHILDTEYNDTAGGLSGNDDAGQMSAWYVFSSMGFYPVCPATDRYMLAAPRFQKVTLNLQNGHRFTITPNSLPKDRSYITHSEIVEGNN